MKQMNKPIADQPKDEVIVKAKKPLQFIMTEAALNRFSNYAVIQHDAESFTLSFFDIQKPFVMGSQEEVTKAMDALEAIPTVCVARVIMTPNTFRLLIAAMQSNLERYESAQKDQRPA
jgi:hypothetical protein